MPYVTPITVAPGEIWTASQHNQDVRDNVIDLDSRMDTAIQLVAEEITTLDGTGSLPQDPDTTVAYLNGVGTADVNGAAVPTRSPWCMFVINISANVATLKHEDATETTPAKRFILPNDTDLALGLGDGVTFIYVSVPVGARWVAVVAA